MTNIEFKEKLEKRTKEFAVSLIKWLGYVPNTKVLNTLVFQLCRSGTSIGANYREANRAVSKADFKNKICTVEKEANESVFWLELFIESDLLNDELVERAKGLLTEAEELLKLFSSISRTTRNSLMN